MGDLGDMFSSFKAYKQAIRTEYGRECPKCKEVRPEAHPSILLPQQVCIVDGYKDGRPRLTEDQKRWAAAKHGVEYWERTK